MKILLFFVVLMVISLYNPALGLGCAHALTLQPQPEKTQEPIPAGSIIFALGGARGEMKK